MDDAERGANAIVSVDLENQVITGPDGGSITFEVDPFRKHCLLNGLDDIGLTMEKADAIDAFEAKQAASTPWLRAGLAAGPQHQSSAARGRSAARRRSPAASATPRGTTLRSAGRREWRR